MTCILIIMILVAGCDSSAPNMVFTVAPETVSILPENSPLTTPIAPPISTTTPTLPVESTISPNSIPTQPYFIYTSTSEPTLNATGREKFVKELLLTNANCELPCWWGIKPSSTPWSEGVTFLQALGVTIGSKSYVVDRTLLDEQQCNENSSNCLRKSPEVYGIFHGIGGLDFESLQIYNNLGIVERTGIVDSIYIRSEGAANPTDFQAVWKRYSPERVMKAYGKPSRIWIRSTSTSYGGVSGYQLWFFYDQSGFVIKYDGEVEFSPIYHICPHFNTGGKIARIDMLLQSPDNELSLERIDNMTEFQNKYIRSIEEATGMSSDEFYQILTKPNKTECFDVPSSAFP